MREPEMTITQGDNGWILTFTGHDCLDTKVITTKWARVIKEVNDYFGWYDIDGKQSEKPFYDEENK